MYRMLKPIGIIEVLMGAVLLFGSLYLVLGSSMASSAEDGASVNMADPLGDVSSHLPCAVDRPQVESRSMEGQLQSSGKLGPFTRGLKNGPKWESKGPSIFKDSKESTVIDGPAPSTQVGDLMAVNAKKERDITFDEWQTGNDSTGFLNTMDIGVNPDKNTDKMDESNSEWLGRGSRSKAQSKAPGNYLNVEVSKISVTATNTVEGGSAVATSNIIIKPVQYIVCPSEVEEKLK